MRPRDLSAHAEYRPGRGIEEVARERGRDPDEFVVLSSNENPFGPSPAAVEAIHEYADRVSAYPKAAHTDLTAAIARRWDVESVQVWLAPSGDAAIDYLSRAMLQPGDDVLAPAPGFAYYAMSARYHHGGEATYPVEKAADFAMRAETVLDAYDGERIVYLTSPHNPTGGRFAIDDVEAIADGTDEETLVVVDEAYAEFAGGTSTTALIDGRDDVAVLRTFSKAYGLAGLRLGYALVPSEWADAYARVNTPFAAGELSCRAGLAALEDHDHVERTVEAADWARAYMDDAIDAPTWESHGNFVLVEVGDAAAVTESMIERGVIVRDCTSFGLPECVRITCGTEDGTRRAVEALNAVLSERR